MARASRCEQPLVLLMLCLVLAVQGGKRVDVGVEDTAVTLEHSVVSSTRPIEELRQAIDELKSLIRVADDIQDSIKKATVRHARLLRRAQLELTSSASGGDTYLSFGHPDWHFQLSCTS